MARFGYPVLLELAGRRCVVVGERAVAAGKVAGLLEGGADDVLVLAEGPGARLDALAPDPRVRTERRRWQPGDLDGAFLLVGWAAERAERDRLAAEARARGVLTNVIDDAPSCEFAAPALVRRGGLVVAIGTGGACPALAGKLREELERRFGAHWAVLVGVLGEIRAAVAPLVPDLAERSRRWSRALDLAEADRLVGEGRAEELRVALTARLLDGAAGP